MVDWFICSAIRNPGRKDKVLAKLFLDSGFRRNDGGLACGATEVPDVRLILLSREGVEALLEPHGEFFQCGTFER